MLCGLHINLQALFPGRSVMIFQCPFAETSSISSESQLVQLPDQLCRYNFKARSNFKDRSCFSGLYPVKFWACPRLELPKCLWVVDHSCNDSFPPLVPISSYYPYPHCVPLGEVWLQLLYDLHLVFEDHAKRPKTN